MKKILNLTVFLFLCLFCISSASIFIGAQNKSFRADTLYDDDLYLAGNSIRFESQITGDLIGACQDFVYSGQSQGGVNWAARHINIIGPVAGSVRAFAQTIEINSIIGRNLIVFAQSVNLGPSTDIARDASLFGSQVSFEGKVSGKMKIDGERIKISGIVEGDLTINALELEVSPNTVINGRLIYKSPNEAKIPAGAVIQGEIKWLRQDKEAKSEKYHAFRSITSMIMGFMLINIIASIAIFILSLFLGNIVIIPLIYLSLIASGLITLGLTKNKATKCVAIMKERPWVSIGLGFVIMLIFPLAIGLTIITLIGIPIAVLILFGCGILMFLGAIYTALYIGSLLCKLAGIKKQEPSLVCLLLGIFTLTSASLIPVLGILVILVTLMFGLGATVLSFEMFNPKKISETLAPPENK
jgi:cytoskeletal protein CcmA (bactofilin family)